MKLSFYKNLIIATTPLILMAASGLLVIDKNKFNKEFNPDAGLVQSLTENATVTASSNPSDISKITDGDLSTAWQSTAPLPDGFIKNKNQNLLLGKKPIATSYTSIKNRPNMTDGDLNNMALISAGNGVRKMSFHVEGINIFSVSIKCQANSDIEILAEMASGKKERIGIYLPGQNYQLILFDIKLKQVYSILIESENDFGIFEIAALSTPPKESIIFKFDSPKKIGTVKTKCWAGNNMASATTIYTSIDGSNWAKAAILNPNTTNEQLIGFPERAANYLKVEHELIPNNWNKVFFWEIKAYDKNGPYGEKPAANASAVSIKELLGINGYWSWGTDQYSFLLGKDEGPRRYSPLASHARNYHDMTWDIQQPGQPIDFSKMKTQGTNAKEWLDWDKEYQEWVDAGLNIEASLQFYRFQPNDWKTPYKSAFDYAKVFTNHFGPKNGNGLICSIEAGNEPWKYPADVYQEILLGMVDGAKDADPSMEVLPCALQAVDPDAEKSGIFKNYIGARITQESAEKLDGVNVHAYSYVTGLDGQRKAVHPEHPQSSFWEIINMVRWRDSNMRGKKIYLSEWGWDSNGGNETCTHSECVSDESAAAYAVRGALIAGRLGIERATWYFYANEKSPSSLYSRSGLTASINQGFQKKKCFYNLEALVSKAGEYYFLKILKEDESAWVYLYGDKMGTPTCLIGWLPLENGQQKTVEVELTVPYEITKCWVLDGSPSLGQDSPVPSMKNGKYLLQLSTMPIIFSLKK